MPLTLRVIVCAWCLVASRAVLAGGVIPECSPEVFGPLSDDPLMITAEWDLPAGCTLDFGDREVVLAGTLRARDLTVLAGSLRVLATGQILGGPGVTRLVLRQGRLHDGSAEILGLLENRDLHAGGIVIICDGSVNLGDGSRLEASGSGGGGSGGSIVVEARGPIVTPPGASILCLAGDPGGFGGAVSLSSSESGLKLAGPIRVSGGLDGPGLVTISAAGELFVTGPIEAAGRCSRLGDCSPGGIIRLTAAGALDVSDTLDASGPDGAAEAGEANGGEVTLDAGGDLGLSGRVVLSGGELGRGGTFRARCEGDFTQRGQVDAGGRGKSSSGGAVSISSGGTAILEGGLGAAGGPDGDAGAVSLEAAEDVHLGGTVDVSGNYPNGGVEVVSLTGAVRITGKVGTGGIGPFGTGGPLALYANTHVLVEGGSLLADGDGAGGLGGAIRLDGVVKVHTGSQSDVLSRGDDLDPSFGQGGRVDLQACQVVVEPKSSLLATGETGGAISLTSSGGGMAVGGSLQAVKGGVISLRNPPGLLPDLTGAEISPAPYFEATYLAGECLVSPPCDPVAQLACDSRGAAVSLSWQGSLTHAGATILRDGVEVGSAGAAEEAFTEAGVPAGDHVYTVVAHCLAGDADAVSCGVTVISSGPRFRRGFCNADGDSDISDAVSLLQYLFLGGAVPPPCLKACDTNDDGGLDISDAVADLAYLFLGGREPPAPLLECGSDPTQDELTCEAFPLCGG